MLIPLPCEKLEPLAFIASVWFEVRSSIVSLHYTPINAQCFVCNV